MWDLFYDVASLYSGSIFNYSMTLSNEWAKYHEQGTRLKLSSSGTVRMRTRQYRLLGYDGIIIFDLIPEILLKEKIPVVCTFGRS